MPDTRTNDELSAEVQRIKDLWTCTCAFTAPTMPTARMHHLPECNVSIANALVRKVRQMSAEEKVDYLLGCSDD